MRAFTFMLALALANSALCADDPRDPTRPPTPAEVAAWFGNGMDERQRAPFRLQSILLAPERRIAIIDGQRLRVGDTLGDAEVRAIEPGRVVLDRGGERIELNIDTHLLNDKDGS